MSLDSLTQSVDRAVSGFFEPIATWLGEIVFYSVPVGGTELPMIVAWLVVAGLVFTGWFGGTVSGGPMHYLPKDLAERFGKNGKTLGKVLAVLASFMILFFGLFGGNLFQVNQSYAQLVSVTGGEVGALGSSAGALFFGILIAALVGIVLLGGIRSIASVTSKLVPAMAGIYIAACLVASLSTRAPCPPRSPRSSRVRSTPRVSPVVSSVR